MATSEDTSNKGIDVSVGGLVWVRRRNGSWWPGQILGPEELPERCLVSPKSGTPVKLLGREDAIVDWYNLEKSKRVKGFRCGEYDECIEKAKAVAANISKKSVKYARREDAIIHALELESATITSTSNNESDYVLEFSNEQSEDVGTEGVKRMRGLDDLGTGVLLPFFKRKRSQVAYVQELLLKEKKPKRALIKVLENTMVNVPITCEELSVPNGSYLPEVYNENTINPSIVFKQGCYTSLVKLEVEGQAFSMDKLFDVPLLLEENDSTGYNTCGAAAETNYIKEKTKKVAKEWQLKGKRNSRNTGKSKKQEDRTMDEFDGYLVGKEDCKFKPISEIQLTETKSHKEEPHTSVPQRLLPYLTVNPKYEPCDFSVGNNSLYDVNVEVQSSSCRPQHVPYISLMSKLSGRPIVGHPLTVEVLEDGFCEMDDDDLREEEMSDLPSGMPTKIHAFQSPKSRRNWVLSKKMRKLSSITCSRRQMDDDEEEEDTKGRMEKLKSPVVACVPLNVVFSRINAALSRSIRPAFRCLVPARS